MEEPASQKDDDDALFIPTKLIDNIRVNSIGPLSIHSIREDLDGLGKNRVSCGKGLILSSSKYLSIPRTLVIKLVEN